MIICSTISNNLSSSLSHSTTSSSQLKPLASSSHLSPVLYFVWALAFVPLCYNKRTRGSNRRHYIFRRWGRVDVLLHNDFLNGHLRRLRVGVADSFSIANHRLSHRSIITNILKSTRLNFNIFLINSYIKQTILSSNSVKISLTL